MNTERMLLTKLVFLAKKLFPILLIISLFFFSVFASNAWKIATGKQDAKLLMQLVKEVSLLPICVIALIVIIMKGL